MDESILEQNVVVEIAESVGTEDVSTRIQTGTERVKTFLGCEDAGNSDIAFNSPHNRMYYSGNNVLSQGTVQILGVNVEYWYRTIGAQSPNPQLCHWPDVTTDDGLTAVAGPVTIKDSDV